MENNNDMSNRPKGNWGQRYEMSREKKPRYYHPLESSDGCSGNILLIIVFAILFLLACKAQKDTFETGYPGKVTGVIAEDVVMIVEDIIM